MDIATPTDYGAIAAGLTFPSEAFINGRFVAARSGARFTNLNPATATILGEVAAKAPLRRNISQADVGNTALFLLSGLGSAITGQTLYVDAGYSILGI